jgi:cytidyltransferase-like protein
VSRLLTLGTFDTPHAGHAAFLRRCERFADEVVVGVNSDVFAERYKGAWPAFSQGERSRLIAALGYRVLINDGPGRALIEQVKPDVLAVGSDWARRDYHAQIATPQAWLDTEGIALVFLPYTQGISTSMLRERLA